MDNTQPMDQACQPSQSAGKLEGKKQVFNADFAFIAVTAVAVYCYSLMYAFLFLM